MSVNSGRERILTTVFLGSVGVSAEFCYFVVWRRKRRRRAVE